MLYMAYGSNMNREQMQRRCPGAVFIKKMVLKDHRLVFRFHADVEFCEGSNCDVLLWEINAAHEHDLDMYEGVKTGHYRKEYAELENGAKALIYIMNETGVTPPSKQYYAKIKEGYEFYKINLKPLRNALLHSWVARKDTDYTKGRTRRNELQTHKGFKPKKQKGKGKRKEGATLPEGDRPQQQRRPQQMNFNDWLADRKASGRSY